MPTGFMVGTYDKNMDADNEADNDAADGFLAQTKRGLPLGFVRRRCFQF